MVEKCVGGTRGGGPPQVPPILESQAMQRTQIRKLEAAMDVGLDRMAVGLSGNPNCVSYSASPSSRDAAAVQRCCCSGMAWSPDEPIPAAMPRYQRSSFRFRNDHPPGSPSQVGSFMTSGVIRSHCHTFFFFFYLTLAPVPYTVNLQYLQRGPPRKADQEQTITLRIPSQRLPMKTPRCHP
jgi:hypothetical protein